LRADPFRSARRRLTLLYLATIVAIVTVLSAALYEFHARDVRGLERQRVRGEKSPTVAEESRARFAEYLEHLGKSIITADLITIAAGGLLSYLLAARTLQPIKEAVEAEQRFFANAAHDLRTPLAVMRSEAEVALRSGPLDDREARPLITSALEEIRRMSAMVEQMLDLAKSGAPLRPAAAPDHPVDLSKLAAQAGARMTQRAEELGIRLVTETPASVTIRGHVPALERAIYNVLENALSYTKPGGCVTIRARREGNEAVLSVADTGIGIPPEDLPHITEPFFRGDRARGAHTGGAGLGLTIVTTIMQEHRGSLLAESRPGGGTTISLRFPLA
jgi:signal transduction histidine kinase